ncbi:hypothetical protein [Halioxenophilus sp. WMMB6]|uniref:hypothetical protein n=1 Tax=Halioxenophilus sp. WMMB6 TaxID=3073815 RepID=UPI00295F4145|nr:hypothetical protein [Halioxenophilus sp. WMMB6]
MQIGKPVINHHSANSVRRLAIRAIIAAMRLLQATVSGNFTRWQQESAIAPGKTAYAYTNPVFYKFQLLLIVGL